MDKGEELMGVRLAQLRKAKGLTQEELGQMVGLQKAAIAKYEKGRVTNMKRDTIKALSNIFNVSPSWLMGLDDSSVIEYQLSNEELAEFEKIKQMNMLMFNGKEVSKANMDRLNNTLREIFIEALIEKRKKEK